MAFWRGVTHVGGARSSIALAVLPIALPGVTANDVSVALWILTLSHLVVQLIKRTAGRGRPEYGMSMASLIAAPDRFSFPSGHACAAMAIALAWSTTVPMLTIPLVAVATLVGWSRVRLAVHYPGDIIVGQLIAVITTALVLSW